MITTQLILLQTVKSKIAIYQIMTFNITLIYCCLFSANERCVQATAKKVLVRRGYEKVHAALLQTNKSIASAPYKFKKSHFLRPQLKAYESKK